MREEMTDSEMTVVRKLKLDKELTMTVTRNEINGRLFVEYATADRKLVIQKNYMLDSVQGITGYNDFQEKFKSIKDFRKYLGIKE